MPKADAPHSRRSSWTNSLPRLDRSITTLGQSISTWRRSQTTIRRATCSTVCCSVWCVWRSSTSQTDTSSSQNSRRSTSSWTATSPQSWRNSSLSSESSENIVNKPRNSSMWSTTISTATNRSRWLSYTNNNNKQGLKTRKILWPLLTCGKTFRSSPTWRRSLTDSLQCMQLIKVYSDTYLNPSGRRRQANRWRSSWWSRWANYWSIPSRCWRANSQKIKLSMRHTTRWCLSLLTSNKVGVSCCETIKTKINRWSSPKAMGWALNLRMLHKLSLLTAETTQALKWQLRIWEGYKLSSTAQSQAQEILQGLIRIVLALLLQSLLTWAGLTLIDMWSTSMCLSKQPTS